MNFCNFSYVGLYYASWSLINLNQVTNNVNIDSKQFDGNKKLVSNHEVTISLLPSN